MTDKIKKICEYLKPYPQHSFLKSELVRLQELHDAWSTEGTLLPHRNLDSDIAELLANYVLRFPIDDDLIDTILAIVNDLSIVKIKEMDPDDNRDAFKRQFEKDIKQINSKISLERASDGGYQNAYVEIAWAIRRTTHLRLKRKYVTHKKATGPYYVAKRGEDNNLVFSNKPYVHERYISAVEEAKRLAKKTNIKFTVVCAVSTWSNEEAQ